MEDGGRLQLNGMVTGDLIVAPGGLAEVNGTVVGTIDNSGSILVRGMVGPVVERSGSSTKVEAGAVVRS